MREELEKKLFDRFNFFYPEKGAGKTRMIDGFACGDGWFNIILDLCLKIESLRPSKAFEVVQVKEKFGGLRFYTHGANEKIYSLIKEAEKTASKTCELCGSTDEVKKRTRNGWVKNICKRCHTKNLLKA